MFCQNCGRKLNDGASFCVFCGGSAANPQYRQNPAPVYAPPQQKSGSNTLLMIVIIALALLIVLIAVFILLFKLGAFRSRGNTGSSIAEVSSEDGSAGQSSTWNAASQTTTLATNIQSSSTETTALSVSEQTETTTVTTVSALTTTTTATADTRIGGNTQPSSASRNYSTNVRPGFSEFDWCYGQFGLMTQAPAGADIISDVTDYNGGWKAMIIYDPDDGGSIRELDNISISVVSNQNVQVIIDWYLLAPGNSEYTNEEDMADSVFNGAVTNTGISATGPALINIDNFWNEGGKQYALGSLTPQNGPSAYLAMVRP